MDNCIFCSIARGNIPAARIWQDEEFLAILDINPNVKGMTLIITKNHYESYLSDMPQDAYERFFVASREVIDLIKQGLEVKRVALVVEGMGINHAHIKLYPLHHLPKCGAKIVYFLIPIKATLLQNLAHKHIRKIFKNWQITC